MSRMKGAAVTRWLIFSVLMLSAWEAWAQGVVSQSGTVVPGHLPVWSGNRVLEDGGSAGGSSTNVGIGELLQVNPAFPLGGTGPDSTHSCFMDAPTLGPFHALCFDANALGGGLIDYGAYNGASPLPLNFKVNGTVTSYPPSGGGGVAAVTGTAPIVSSGGLTPAISIGLATNAALGAMKGDGSTITCVAGVCTSIGGAATSVVVGTTTVGNSTSGYVLYNNGGTLGNFGIGTGGVTALGVNVGTAGAFVVNGGALGTPSSGVATNLTGTAAGLTAGTVTTNANLTGPITSSGNVTSIASQTGTGTKLVVDNAPTLTTNTAINGLIVSNTYTGGAGTPTAIFGLLDDQTSSGTLTNPDGIYGDLWYDAATTFTGDGAALRGNTYTIPQLTATIAAAGSSYTNNDVVTISGGTCTTELNTAPQFQLTVAGGVVTAATYVKGGSCTVYPSNPVSVTGGTGSSLTLNLTNTSMSVTYEIGVYGRSRHTALGTVTNAIGFFADGAYNSGGGALTNAIGVWINPPYDTNWTNSYGIYLPSGACSPNCWAAGTIAAASDPITIATTGSNQILLKAGGQTTVYEAGYPAATFATPTSAVNYLQLQGAATLNPPIIASVGSDTNINLVLGTKGTGVLQLDTNNTVVMTLATGAQVGAPAGADKGAGTLNLAGSLYDNGTAPTGTSGYVRSTSPTLVTPILGTPTSGNLANTTGYPKATSSTFGIVEPDNTTITISGGVISATAGGTGCTVSGAAGAVFNTGSSACTTDTAILATAGALSLGSSGTAGSVALGNATSGTVTLQPVTGALGSVTASLPANTGTIAELNLAQSFTANQTITSASFGLAGNISAPAWTTSGIRYVNTPATLTDTTSNTTVATVYNDVWGGNTNAASSATTYTNLYGSYFKVPIAGTNVTATNKYALGADSINTPTLTATTFNGIGITASTGTLVPGTGTATFPAGNSGTVAELNVKQSWTAAQRGTPTNITISTATFTPNFDTAQNFEIDLTSACPCTLANPSTTLVAGQSGIIEVHQDGTGSRTVGTWGSDYQYVGGTSTITLSTAASAVDYLPYYVNNAATGIVFGTLIKAPAH
jgi:hypothetical protein